MMNVPAKQWRVALTEESDDHVVVEVELTGAYITRGRFRTAQIDGALRDVERRIKNPGRAEFVVAVRRRTSPEKTFATSQGPAALYFIASALEDIVQATATPSGQPVSEPPESERSESVQQRSGVVMRGQQARGDD